jgi:hypothetical protein
MKGNCILCGIYCKRDTEGVCNTCQNFTRTCQILRYKYPGLKIYEITQMSWLNVVDFDNKLIRSVNNAPILQLPVFKELTHAGGEQ